MKIPEDERVGIAFNPSYPKDQDPTLPCFFQMADGEHDDRTVTSGFTKIL